MIVPNKEQFNLGEPMMVHMFGRSVDDFMPKQRYDSLCETYKLHRAWMKKWDSKKKGEGRVWYSGDSPYYNEVGNFDPERWSPFDPTNVYFDDAAKEIAKEVKRYNRIAVIVQGLFDRSEVLHPHLPVKMWEGTSFERSIELIYDAMTLTHGEKPDFEAFRAELNALIDADSILTGQEDFWLRCEAVKENRRIENDYRHRGTPTNYVRYRPDEFGPPTVGKADEWKPRAKKAIFRWTRESRNYRARSWERNDAIPQSLAVPVAELFNVSAYKPGDFKRFFADPRTRREYLKWAPLLLTAEDYYAGKNRRKRGSTTRGSSW
jgi:hypothetical protein